MKLNKGDIIKDGEEYFSIFCVMCRVVYIQRVTDVNGSPDYELEEILKHYRKIEIVKS